MRNSVHDRLKQLIQHLGLKITEFSEKSDIPYRTLQDYLSGKIIPGGENLQKMNLVFHASIDWILTGKGSMFFRPTSAADRVAEAPIDYLDNESRMILDMLRGMNKEQKREALRFFEGQKLIAERDKKLKEG